MKLKNTFTSELNILGLEQQEKHFGFHTKTSFVVFVNECSDNVKM